MPLSNKERAARVRKRKRAAGLTPIQVWVPREKKEKILEMIKKEITL